MKLLSFFPSIPPRFPIGFEPLRESSFTPLRLCVSASLRKSFTLCVDRPPSAFPFILSPALPCDHCFLCAFASQRLCVNLFPFAWIALSAPFPLSSLLPFLAIIGFFAPSRLSVFAFIFNPPRFCVNSFRVGHPFPAFHRPNAS